MAHTLRHSHGGADWNQVKSKGEKVRSFLLSNFLLMGLVICVSLAKWNPAFGRIGGPLRPEFYVNTIGE